MKKNILYQLLWKLFWNQSFESSCTNALKKGIYIFAVNIIKHPDINQKWMCCLWIYYLDLHTWCNWSKFYMILLSFIGTNIMVIVLFNMISVVINHDHHDHHHHHHHLIFLTPWNRGHIVLQLFVGRYVGRSVCRLSVVCSISFDPFTLSIPNLVQGLPSISRWSLLIFRSHVQRSRSNHSSQPTCFWNISG